MEPIQTEEDVELAIEKLKKLFPLSIVRSVSNLIVIATSEGDYLSKRRKILDGDTDGFFTINEAFNLP